MVIGRSDLLDWAGVGAHPRPHPQGMDKSLPGGLSTRAGGGAQAGAGAQGARRATAGRLSAGGWASMLCACHSAERSIPAEAPCCALGRGLSLQGRETKARQDEQAAQLVHALVDSLRLTRGGARPGAPR